MLFSRREIKRFFFVLITLSFSNLIGYQKILSQEIIDINNKSVHTESQNKFLTEDYYIIGPGDTIIIDILDDKKEPISNQVLNDGSLAVPYIGNIKISGLSISQAKNLIENKLETELLRSDINLRVSAPRVLRVSVLGQVENPGVHIVKRNSTSVLPTVIEAIQESGGITQQANLTKVEVTRRLPGFETSYKKTEINLLDLILNGNQKQNLLLFDGDKIYIPKAEISTTEKLDLVSTNLTPRIINVYIVGEVNSPGKIPISSKTPLVQAILASGGPIKWRGNTGNVQLVRVNRNGTITNKKLKINLKQGASGDLNPLLKDGDIIKVERTEIATFTDAVTEVTKPFTGILNAVSIFKLLD